MAVAAVLLATSGPALAQPEDATDLFADGFQMLQEGDAAGAQARFEAGLRLDSSDAIGWFYLGEALQDEDRLIDAALAYRRSLREGPDSPVSALARERLGALPDAPPPAVDEPAPPPPPITPPLAATEQRGLAAAQLPPRPTLTPVPPVSLPPSFCTEAARNAFYASTYKPAYDIALADNAAAKQHLDRLLMLHADDMKLSLDAANAVTLEAVAYEPIAQAAFRKSWDYAALFDTLMATPTDRCP